MKTFNFEDIVPVGKYKNQTFKEMSKDHFYFDWFLTWVCRLPKWNSDFMYHQDMKDLKWKRRKEKANTKHQYTSYNTCNSGFATSWAEDVYGGYDSSAIM